MGRDLARDTQTTDRPCAHILFHFICNCILSHNLCHTLWPNRKCNVACLWRLAVTKLMFICAFPARLVNCCHRPCECLMRVSFVGEAGTERAGAQLLHVGFGRHRHSRSLSHSTGCQSCCCPNSSPYKRTLLGIISSLIVYPYSASGHKYSTAHIDQSQRCG